MSSNFSKNHDLLKLIINPGIVLIEVFCWERAYSGTKLNKEFHVLNQSHLINW